MRWVEDVGFLAAIGIALAYGLAEAAARIGACIGPCAPDAPFPWGLLLILGALVLPKVLGRATAGAIWTAIASRIGGKGGQS